MPPELVWYPLALGGQVARGERALADVAEAAVRLGVESVALPDALLAPSGGAHSVPAVRQVMDAAGVRVAAVLAAPNFASPLLETRQKERFTAERVLDAAGALGATLVRFTIGPIHPGIAPGDARKLALGNLSELAALAQKRGIAVCVENVLRDARWPASDVCAPPDAFEELLRRVEQAHLGVMFNTGNPALVGADPLAVLAAVPEKCLAAVALSEREPPHGVHVPLGDGPAPWRRLKAALRGRGFAGPFLIVDGQTGGEAGTVRSLAFARSWLAGWDDPLGY